MTEKIQVLHSNGMIEIFRPRFIKEQLLNETDISTDDAEKIQRRVAEKIRGMGVEEVSTSTIRAEVNAQLTSRRLFEAEENSRKLGMSVAEFEDLMENGCKDNANMDFSPEMIAKYAYDSIAKEYALLKMPKECSEAHINGFQHHHDLESAVTRPNCFNADLRFYAKNGLKVDGKGIMGSAAKPAKTLEVLLNHMLQAWMAGATVFSGGQGYVNFNTLLAPFARGRTYKDIKQAIQGFIYNCNMSLIARGGQILFSSIGIDLSIPSVLKNEPAIGPEGIANGVYGDYQEEADLIFKAICEVLDEKDGMGAFHRFPNCYASDTPITVRKDGIIKITTIGEFVDSCISKDYDKYFDSKISTETDGYEILSWNASGNYPEWKRITTAIQNPNQDIYEVTTRKGLKLHVTEEHPFICINGGKAKHFDKGKPLKEFKTHDRLMKLNTPILSYNENKIGTFIGFFLGDGSVDKNSKNNRILFKFWKKEKAEYLIDLLEKIGFNYKFNERADSKDNKVEYSISLIDTKQDSKQASEVIQDCVLMKNTALLEKYNNHNYYLGLFSGLINSDGSIQVSRNIDKPSVILKFSNTSTELTDLFINIGNLYGLNISKKIKQVPVSENHCLRYDLFCRGINTINLLSSISLHKIHKDKLLSLDAKCVSPKNYNSSSIKSIEKIYYDGFTYDLEVADNHNYFAGEGNVLSHNCLFNIREGDLDEYTGNCKILHELGANNPTIYYVNCTELERTVMGCFSGEEGLWCKIGEKIIFKTFKELSEDLVADYGVTPVDNIKVLTIDDNKNVIWMKAKNFVKNKERELYKITLTGNKTFICDDTHSMIMPKTLAEKNISELSEGDEVLGVDCDNIKLTQENSCKKIKVCEGQKIESIEKINRIEDTYCFEVNGRIIIGNDFILTGQCRTALPMNYTGKYEEDCINTGNFMYSTLNLPLIALESKDKQDFYNKLNDMCEIIYKTLHWRRDVVSDVIYNKHMSDFLLQKDKETGKPLYNFDTTTMTIGFCGLNECLHILDADQKEGIRIVTYLNSMKEQFNERDGLRWSVIASPAESASHRFATIIKEKYPDAPVQGTKDHYYLTNSSHIPVSEETTIIDHIENAGIYQPLTLGGNILHVWLGEVWSDPESLWKLNQKIIKEGVIFWAYSKVFTYCNKCGFTINDNIEECPICKSRDLVTYDRITGYYIPTRGFNNGKQQEFKDRFRHSIG